METLQSKLNLEFSIERDNLEIGRLTDEVAQLKFDLAVMTAQRDALVLMIGIIKSKQIVGSNFC